MHVAAGVTDERCTTPRAPTPPAADNFAAGEFKPAISRGMFANYGCGKLREGLAAADATALAADARPLRPRATGAGLAFVFTSVTGRPLGTFCGGSGCSEVSVKALRNATRSAISWSVMSNLPILSSSPGDGFVRAAAPLGVKLDHILQRVERAVVHIRSCEGDVA